MTLKPVQQANGKRRYRFLFDLFSAACFACTALFFFRSPFGRLLRLHGPRIHFVLFSASFFNEVLVWLSWLLFFAFCLLLFNFVCAFRFYVYGVVFTLLFFFVFAVCLFSVLGSTFVLCFC